MSGPTLLGATRVRAPHGQDEAHDQRNHPVAVTATAARVDTELSSALERRWISVICTVPFHIRFGSSPSDATTQDFRYPADTEAPFELRGGEDQHFSVIRSGADDGSLDWYWASDTITGF